MDSITEHADIEPIRETAARAARLQNIVDVKLHGGDAQSRAGAASHREWPSQELSLRQTERANGRACRDVIDRHRDGRVGVARNAAELREHRLLPATVGE